MISRAVPSWCAVSATLFIVAGVHGQVAENRSPASVTLSAPEDFYLRAEALMRQGKYEDALRSINEALQIDPKRGAAYGLRSGILGDLQQYDEGLADAELGISFSKTPRDKSRAAYNKGFNLSNLNRKTEALEAYRLSTQFDPTYSRAYLGRGKLYFNLRMWKEARAEMDKALKITPDVAAAWAYRAESQMALGAVKDGMASAIKAVELDPNDPRGFRARAVGFQMQKHYDQMLADTTRALDLESVRPEFYVPLLHLLRGRALGFLGRHNEELAEYAAEPDRKAVEPYLNEVHQTLYGSRVNNPGCKATTYPVPGAATTLREMCGWDAEVPAQASPPAKPTKPAKRRVPGIPAPRP